MSEDEVLKILLDGEEYCQEVKIMAEKIIELSERYDVPGTDTINDVYLVAKETYEKQRLQY